MAIEEQSAIFLPLILQDNIFSFRRLPSHTGHVLVITIVFRASFLVIFSLESFFRNAFSILGMIPSYLTVFPQSL